MRKTKRTIRKIRKIKTHCLRKRKSCCITQKVRRNPSDDVQRSNRFQFPMPTKIFPDHITSSEIAMNEETQTKKGTCLKIKNTTNTPWLIGYLISFPFSKDVKWPNSPFISTVAALFLIIIILVQTRLLPTAEWKKCKPTDSQAQRQVTNREKTIGKFGLKSRRE